MFWASKGRRRPNGDGEAARPFVGRPLVAAGVALIAWGSVACDDDSSAGPAPPSPGAGGSGQAGAAAGGGGFGGGGAAAGGGGNGGQDPCPRPPAAANRVRQVVLSHPYADGGSPAPTYAVWTLSESGELGDAGMEFSLGRAVYGAIAFTPDGEIGIVAQEDGTLGVFGWEAGVPHVIHAAFSGSFYASDVVMGPAGKQAYVLDPNWRDNGGGVYVVSIGCDGTLTDEGMLLAAKLPAALLPLPSEPQRAVLVANDAFDSPLDLDAHLLDWGAEAPAWLDGVDAFPDDEAIVASAAITPDGHYALIGDNSSFSGVDNRVAIVAVQAQSLVPTQVLSPLEDPFAIVASPFGDAALVVSGFGDAIFALSHDPQSPQSPFANTGELSYQGDAPQLPGTAVLVDRGDLTGLVLVAENQGVRRVRFEAGGQVVDLGLTSYGQGIPYIVGAIGVQP